ncbi:MAG: F0F1 ATP synthase subunit A [Spirochaetota bacterium]
MTKFKAFILTAFLLASSATWASGSEHNKPFDLADVLAHHLMDHAFIPLNFGGKKVMEGEPGYDPHHASAVFEDHTTHKKYHFVGGLDLHITKRVTMMWIAAVFLLAVFIPAANKIKANPNGVASRFTNVVEVLVNFIRKDVADVNMDSHHHGDAKPYYGYVLSLFFFILFCNLFGLIPPVGEYLALGNSHSFIANFWSGITATGDVSVTGSLAAITFLLIFVTGFAKQGPSFFFVGIVPKGVPAALYPMLWFLEALVSPLAKVFALTIRLFANMTAGHIIILAFMGFIFQFQNYLVAIPSISGSVAIFLLEIFVAFLQAYIFTLLTCLFVGSAMHRH